MPKFAKVDLPAKASSAKPSRQLMKQSEPHLIAA
jgi:hypothetical protein